MGSFVSLLAYENSSEEKDQSSCVSNEVYETESSKADTETTPVVAYSPSSTSTHSESTSHGEIHPRENEVLNDLSSLANLAHVRANELDRNDIVRDLWNQAERRDANNLMTYKKLSEGLQRVTEMTQDEAKFLFVPLG